MDVIEDTSTHLMQCDNEIYQRNLKIYESGYKRWESINNGKEDQEKQFDKTAFAIAAGSFGVSFAFIDKVIPLKGAVHRPVLAAAWACFGACLLILLIGYRISAAILRSMQEEETQNVKKRYKDKPVRYKKRKVFSNAAEICNYLTFIAIAGGMSCLISFVFLNF
jgi:hypothetical protein